MKDKSMGTLLMVLFGISGIAVLLLAWLWPPLASERIMATLSRLSRTIYSINPGTNVQALIGQDGC